MPGERSSLQNLQDLSSFFTGSSQRGQNEIEFLQNLQNLEPLVIGLSQYGHLSAVI